MNDDALLLNMGKKITRLRKAAGFSQQEFALYIDIGTASYGRIERGEQNTTICTLAKIARALNVDMGDLLPSFRELKSKKKGNG